MKQHQVNDRMPSRWWSLLLMGLVGWAVSFTLVRLFEDSFESVAALFASFGTWLLAGLLLLIALPIALHEVHGRFAVFLTGGSVRWHPPLWVAVLMGCVAHTLALFSIDVMSESPENAVEQIAALWTAVAILCFVVLLAGSISVVAGWRGRAASVEFAVAEGRDDLLTDPNRLDTWLDGDDHPIRLPSEDLFGHRRVASRIARRLNEAEECTVLLLAPKGAGKSSLFELTRHYIAMEAAGTPRAKVGGEERPRIRLVRLSAWAFDDSRALIAGVLNAILDDARAVADTYSLIGLPSRYLAAISSAGGWFAGLAGLLAPCHSPEQAVQRISEVLRAVGVRVVIWVDDLERFGVRRQSLETIQALLALFREKPNVSFVLAEDGSVATTSGLDYLKLTTYHEDLPPLDPLRVAQIVEAFRTAQRARYQDIDVDPKASQDPDPFRAVTTFEVLLTNLSGPTVWMAIGNILSTPRKLKSVLRRTRAAWTVLHGEVDFDELLVIRVLSESEHHVRVGEASEPVRVAALVHSELLWLRRRLEDRARSDRAREEPSPEQAALAKLLDARSPEATLIRYLFTERRGDTRPQTVARQQPTDYWRRIHSEDLEPGVRDQEVRSAVRGFERAVQTGDGPSSTDELVQSFLVGRPIPEEQAIQFSICLSLPMRRQLVQAVLDALIANPSASPRERHHPLALIALARFVDQVPYSREARLAQVREAIGRVMPQSLLLAHAIEYWLVHRGDELSPGRVDPSDERAEVATHARTRFIQAFGSTDGPARLLAAIRDDEPWVLSWTINRRWERDPPMVADVAEWQGVAGALVSAAEMAPGLAGRAVALCLIDSERARHPDCEPVGPSRQTDRGEWLAEVNVERARALFGGEFARAMLALAKVPVESEITHEAAGCRAVRDYARRWVEQNL